MSYIADPDLGPVLVAASDYDLGILADHITDSGAGRISLSGESCKRLTDARIAGRFDAGTRALIAEELSRFGGNSLMNMWRGSGVGYDEIVRDVAEHLGVTVHSRASCGDIEQAVVLKMAEQSFKKMSDAQKVEFIQAFDKRYADANAAGAMGVLATINATPGGGMDLATVVANGAATALLGRGLATSAGVLAGSSGVRLATVFLGAIGWAFTVIWTAFGLTSPAYRVTVPCVIQAAYMRLKMNAVACPQCRTAVTPGSRFCSTCGTPLAARLRLANDS
jgi:uncharacterized protein YaaW (UPF0174 family)